MKIHECLPNYFHPGHGGNLPPGLIGAKILRFGQPSEIADCEGGGLAIEYLPSEGGEPRLVLLSFNELGMEEVQPTQGSFPKLASGES